MTMATSCRYCGCTNDRACSGGCHWHRPEYCSACAEKHLEQLVDLASSWIGAGDTGVLGGFPCRLVDDSEQLEVVDHIGLIAFSIGPDEVYLAPQYCALDVIETLRASAMP